MCSDRPAGPSSAPRIQSMPERGQRAANTHPPAVWSSPSSNVATTPEGEQNAANPSTQGEWDYLSGEVANHGGFCLNDDLGGTVNEGKPNFVI